MSAKTVRARGWCRADLAGGTLDIWPLGLLHPGARTVNVALDLKVVVELTPIEEGYRVSQGESTLEVRSLDELAAHEDGALLGQIALALVLPPFSARIQSESPRGGGLGASSALAVAAIAAGEALCNRKESTPGERSALARDLEARLMQLPTGRQDQYPALLGGALQIRHEPGGEIVERLDVDLDRMGESLVVAYTGQSHFSAGNNWDVVRRRLEQDSKVIECFDSIRDIARQVADALGENDFETVGRLMSAEWGWRRQLSKLKSTPEIEALLSVALENGAWGGKACGAGGGGCVAILCPSETKQTISGKMAELGARVLDTLPASEPLAVTHDLR